MIVAVLLSIISFSFQFIQKLIDQCIITVRSIITGDNDETQWYQMDSTFIALYKALFIEFIENANSYNPDMTFEEWQDVKKHFCTLLNQMNYHENEDHKLAIKSKDEFFILFSKYFYDLWD